MKNRYLLLFFILVVTMLSSLVLAKGAHEYGGGKGIRPTDGVYRGFHIEDVHGRDEHPIAYDVLGSSHANAVRLSIFLKKNASQYYIEQGDDAALEKIVNELSARNICSIFTLRTRGDERGPLWASLELRNSFDQAWRYVAEKYKGNSYVIGFDLMNEPVPPGRDNKERQGVWLEYANQLAASIRKIDTDRLLIVESAPDATPESFASMEPIAHNNVVYSVHSYYPFSLTHQGVSALASKPKTYGFNGANFQEKSLREKLDIVDNFSKKYAVPILVGEFSMVRYSPQDSAYRYIDDSIKYFEEKSWSWLYHDFRGWDGWDSEIAGADKNNRTRSIDSPIFKSLISKMKINRRDQECWKIGFH